MKAPPTKAPTPKPKEEIYDLKKKFNRLAEKAGWKPIPKQIRTTKENLLALIKDLEDCIKAGLTKKEEIIIRKAYRR